MPRQRRGAAPTPARSAPTRPTAPARSAPSQQSQQSQPYSTAAHPQTQQAPPQQSAGSGLFGQMATTAAGVAVGSALGHTISNTVGGLFGGGSSATPAEAVQAMDNDLYQSNSTQSSFEKPACEVDARNFRNCMDENRGDITICGWYLDQLKACQAAAKPY